MNELTPQQALQNLINGCRLAPLPFAEHMACNEAAIILNSIINPPTEVKEVES